MSGFGSHCGRVQLTLRDQFLRRLHTLADEASDHLLDTQEPERTRLMGSITAIRAAIHNMPQDNSYPPP